MARRKPDPVILVPKKPPQVEVVWNDAATFGEAMKLEDVERKATLVECHTTGYLMYEDEKRIVVAQTFNPEDKEVDDVTVIPAPWVRRRRRK